MAYTVKTIFTALCDKYFQVSAPWIKNFFYADYDTYVIPGLDGVTLGGCRNYDGYDTNLSRHDSAAIWERCTRLVPSLMNCTIERESVGLRPHRDPVRIETELIQTKSKPIKVKANSFSLRGLLFKFTNLLFVTLGS